MHLTGGAAKPILSLVFSLPSNANLLNNCQVNAGKNSLKYHLKCFGYSAIQTQSLIASRLEN